MSDSPLTAEQLNPEALINLQALSPDDGGEFLEEILILFLEDTPARIADLHRYHATGNTHEFIRAAHSIKGSSSNIGATELHKIAEQLEHHTRKEGMTASVDIQLSALDAAFQRVKLLLTAIIAHKAD